MVDKNELKEKFEKKKLEELKAKQESQESKESKPEPKPDLKPEEKTKPQLDTSTISSELKPLEVSSTKPKVGFFRKMKAKRNVQTDQKKDEKKEVEKEAFSLAKALMKKKKVKKRKLTYYEHIKNLKKFLEKAAFPYEQGVKYLKWAGGFSILLTFTLSAWLLWASYWRSESIFFIIIQFLGVWTLFLTLIYSVFAFLFFAFIDYLIYERKKKIELVLPDYLQLTSANVSAGMPIDQALWLAVRPRFGVLANEIESVAKATYSGESLKNALFHFSEKYDSLILKRSISILIEGIEAGGKIGPLLDKISVNLQENALFKKEMAANVTTYVIFITFASLSAAPFLFALSTQLLVIITGLGSSMNISPDAAAGSMISIDLSGDSVSITDFKIFAMLGLGMTAMFSAMIVSIIKKGTIKDGIKSIPLYITVAVIVYYFAQKILNLFFGGIT